MERTGGDPDTRNDLQSDLQAWLAATPDGEELFALALSRPAVVTAWCDTQMATLSRAVGPSYAWQARGLAAREVGDVRRAVSHLRRAVAHADRGVDPDRAADTRASLATTLSAIGRTEEALALLEEAERRDQRIRPLVRARVAMRRGAVLRMLGRREEALAVLGAAIPALRAENDPVWEARALGNRALVHLEFGSPARAVRDLERCCALFAAADQGLEAAGAVHMVGWAAYRSGALGAALRSLGEAERLYAEAGVSLPQVTMDRCAVLLAAGLFEEAYERINEFVAGFDSSVRADHRAEAGLLAARAALAAGRPDDARRHAAVAERLYVRQDNSRAVAIARLEGIRAKAALEGTDLRARRALAAQASSLASELASWRAPEAVGAALLAGRVTASSGDADGALAWWERAAAKRRTGPALDRVSGWVAAMLSAESSGSRAGVLAAAESGMRILDSHQLALGATELRAYATEHGRELADGALRQVAERGDAWALLRWSERWRATVVDVPRQSTDLELVALLAALRQVQHELASAPAGSDVAALHQRHAQLERAVLDRSRQVEAAPLVRSGPVARAKAYGRRVSETLGPDHVLVSLAEVAGTLHAVVVVDGVGRRLVVGPAAAAARELDHARFAMRSALSGRSRAGSRESLAATGRLLQSAMLGPAADLLPDDDRTVILVPPARLQGTPWGLLPALVDRAFVVTPSVRAWRRASTATPPRRHSVAVIQGPGLESTGEVPELVALHPKAVVLGGGTATAAAVLREMDGAWLVHLAAHGTFRADNPLFSALHLDDGQLTVHDLEQLRHAPYRLVLSACEVGLGASVGTDELLGVVGALLMLGSAGVVASPLPVPDGVVARLSVELHRRLLAGASSAQALRDVRAALDGDLLSAATAASFVAFGAA